MMAPSMPQVEIKGGVIHGLPVQVCIISASITLSLAGLRLFWHRGGPGETAL